MAGKLEGQASSVSGSRGLDASLYERVLTLLGSTGTIVPIGDVDHELQDRTTVTSVGAIKALFTYSEAITSFDTAPVDRGSGRIPSITFNGTDEEADSPDAAYWTRALASMSIGAWINFSGGDATSSIILSKYDTAGNTREWVFNIDASDKPEFLCYDEDDVATPNAIISTLANSAISSSAWVFVVATYDGTANASGINLYQDGVIVASSDTDDANFASMRDKGGTVKLGHVQAAPANLFDGQMAGGPLGPFFTQTALSAASILNLYTLGKSSLGI